MLEYEDGSVSDYCAEILDVARRRKIPAAFAAIRPELALYAHPLEELPWEPDRVKIFDQTYDARRYGNVLVSEVDRGPSRQLLMPFYCIQIDADRVVAPETQVGAVFNSKLATYNAAFAKVLQATCAGLQNADAEKWLQVLQEQSVSNRKKVKHPEETFYQWDLARVRIAWEFYIFHFEDMVQNCTAMGDPFYFTSDELSVLASCSAHFFVSNEGLGSENVLWQLKNLYEPTRIEGMDRKGKYG